MQATTNVTAVAGNSLPSAEFKPAVQNVGGPVVLGRELALKDLCEDGSSPPTKSAEGFNSIGSEAISIRPCLADTSEMQSMCKVKSISSPDLSAEIRPPLTEPTELLVRSVTLPAKHVLDPKVPPYWLAVAVNDQIHILSSEDCRYEGEWNKSGRREEESLNCVDFSQGAVFMAFCGKEGKVTIVKCDWDHHGLPVKDWVIIHEHTLKRPRELLSMTFSLDGSYIAFGGKDQSMTVCATEKANWKVIKVMTVNAEVRAVRFHDDGGLVGIGSADAELTIVDTSSSPPDSPQQPFIHDLVQWIKAGDIGAFEKVLKEWPHLLSKRSRFGFPALQNCIDANQSALAVKLLEARPLLAFVVGCRGGQEGQTAAELAEQMGDAIVVEQLCQASIRTSHFYPQGCFDLAELLALPSFCGLATRIFEDLPLVEVPCLVQKARIQVGESTTKTMTASKWDSPDHANIWNSVEHPLGFAVTAKRSVWPGLGSVQMLKTLLAAQDPVIFKSATMKLIVPMIWEKHVRSKWLRSFACYLGYAAIVSVGSVLMVIDQPIVTSKIMEIGRHVLPGVSGASAFYFLSKESGQCLSDPAGYFFVVWNIFDLTAHFLVMFCVAIHYFNITGYIDLHDHTEQGPKKWLPWQNQEGYCVFLGLSCLFVTLNLLQHLRGFDSTAALVQMMVAILRDIVPLLIIAVIVIVAFHSYFFFALRKGHEYPEQPRLLETFEAGLFAELGGLHDAILGSSHPNWNRWMHMIFMIGTSVVILNALIAIMGDTYARITESKDANVLMQRAQTIVEFLEVLDDHKLKEIEDGIRWFHILVPRVDDQRDFGWSGQVDAIRKELRKTELRMVDLVRSIEMRQEARDNELNDTYALQEGQKAIQRTLSCMIAGAAPVMTSGADPTSPSHTGGREKESLSRAVSRRNQIERNEMNAGVSVPSTLRTYT